MLVSAVSCACNAVNWFFHGVSTACRFATIALTVVATSKPWPLVGEPKEIPTLPIMLLSALSGQSITRNPCVHAQGRIADRTVKTT
jgi:hypothetical protein